MRKLTSFLFVTLNGFYKGPDEDISWHVHDEEGNRYSEQQLEAGNILVFGRKTYEMMYGFWPSSMAYDLYPKVAKGMNEAEKIVLSNTLTTADWSNTTILSDDAIEQLRKLKSTPGKDLTILGSGSLVDQLTSSGLIDRYEILLDPVIIPRGTGIFQHLQHNIKLNLEQSRSFRNGAVLLTYLNG